jgi:hypothetical protein
MYRRSAIIFLQTADAPAPFLSQIQLTASPQSPYDLIGWVRTSAEPAQQGD